MKPIDSETKKCYIVFLPQYFEKSLIVSFQNIFQIISELKNLTTTNYAIVATTFPEVLEDFVITAKKGKKLN